MIVRCGRRRGRGCHREVSGCHGPHSPMMDSLQQQQRQQHRLSCNTCDCPAFTPLETNHCSSDSSLYFFSTSIKMYFTLLTIVSNANGSICNVHSDQGFKFLLLILLILISMVLCYFTVLVVEKH